MSVDTCYQDKYQVFNAGNGDNFICFELFFDRGPWKVKTIYFKFIFFKYEQKSTGTNINKIYQDIHQKQEIYKGLHQKSNQIKQSSITFVIC